MSHSYQPRQTERTDFIAVLAKVCLVTFLTSLGIVVLYPLFWMALNGFKTNAEIFGNPFALPSGFSITNYIAAWNQGIRNYIATSVIVTVGSAFCTVLVSAWTRPASRCGLSCSLSTLRMDLPPSLPHA